MLRLYLIKGMPFLGFINLSGGLGVLGEKAKVMPGVEVIGPVHTVGPLHRWAHQYIIDDIKAHPNAGIAIAGHSYGANYATYIADAIYPRNVAHLSLYDATSFATMMGTVVWPIRDNVESVINFRGLNRAIGGARVALAPGNSLTRLLDIPTSVSHGAVDDAAAFHTLTLQDLRKYGA